MQRFLMTLLAITLCVIVGSAQAQLPKDWRTVFKPGPQWQLGCMGSGRGRACLPTIYHFSPEADEVGDNDIIVGMVFSMSRGNLYIEPWQGTCVGGQIKVDGRKLTDLAKSLYGCVTHGGRPFMYRHKKHNFFNISTLSEASTLDVSLELEDGTRVNKSISLKGFKDRFNEYHANSQSGSRGGRRG